MSSILLVAIYAEIRYTVGMSKKKHHHKIAKVIDMIAVGNSDSLISRTMPNISHQTIGRIRRSNGEVIEAKKAIYIKLIDKETGGDTGQAKVISQALTAETEIYNFKGEIVGTRPDHKIRLDTIKYIDKLKGRDSVTNLTTNNTLIINKELDKYIK